SNSMLSRSMSLITFLRALPNAVRGRVRARQVFHSAYGKPSVFSSRPPRSSTDVGNKTDFPLHIVSFSPAKPAAQDFPPRRRRKQRRLARHCPSFFSCIRTGSGHTRRAVILQGALKPGAKRASRRAHAGHHADSAPVGSGT